MTRGAVVDYNKPQDYIIGGVKVSGVKFLGEEQIISLTGLSVGDKITIPGDELSSIVKRIWMQRFFSDVGIFIDSTHMDTVFLKINLQERPRVSRWEFEGVKSGEKTDLNERLKLRRGSELSDYILSSSSEIIRKFYVEKGFLQTEVSVKQEEDTLIVNAAKVTFVVDKKSRVKIKQITFEGNNNIKGSKLASAMKKTKDMRILNFFSSKKFDEKEYDNDKKLLLQKYSEAGYRDARILKDSIYYLEDGRLAIKFVIDEGNKYYFRDITWTGNSIYDSEGLNSILRIAKGDVYDVVSMEKRLFEAEDGNISKLYRDRGYLFFRVIPVEKSIVGDSVDVEMRMFEGKPANFNRIIINGNNVTNEKVARRELFTRPGYLFNQTYLERSLRGLAAMGHFDPEKLMSATGYSVVPNENANTVDITYNLEEKSNSQFEIAGGWGGNTFVGTLGISFNNFSLSKVFDKKSWRPVPLGDGQQLSIKFQTNGSYYTAFSASFTEPWLFGNKPTSLSVSTYYTKQTNSTYFYQNSGQSMEVYGMSAGIGTRLKWPDNEFILYNELSVQSYKLTDWQYYFIFKDGISNNISWKIRLQRNSTDQPIYPRSGSDFQLGLQITPPYSLFRPADTDYKGMTDAQRYKWIEYHKWTFKGSTFNKLVGDLVLMTRVNFGYLGYYSRSLGYSPFEGFILGGDGMSGYNTYGSEVIGLRGYPNNSLTPRVNDSYSGNVYDKFTLELRYPIVLQPQSTIYALVFLEGGNSWSDIRDFNPFSIKRSAGFGVRVLLPIVGMLGIDWGYGFDPVESKARSGSNFHFVIGQQF
ncbi:MAG: outer membrane protein assembly factor BamA [Bacteroidetes bacterium GWF2_41_61]|nr:MAG: outer membrane protein assembly factor BamA [Bacteroidetes bacterium GWE2_40_15]OFY33945.1 MAG: outer membrane protein assembly factor BamA [Bacteroidetes bacterium GWF2_41_61]OFY88662.1 MAG: outer membrane protein assembly factor BamA [Bacteroidetes bacterium RIFOXYA12_FULL_40_10]